MLMHTDGTTLSDDQIADAFFDLALDVVRMCRVRLLNLDVILVPEDQRYAYGVFRHRLGVRAVTSGVIPGRWGDVPKPYATDGSNPRVCGHPVEFHKGGWGARLDSGEVVYLEGAA